MFLCNSVYWNGVDGKVKVFLKAPCHKIGKLVNVSTAALKESTYKQIKTLAEGIGIGDEKSYGGCVAAGRGFFHINSHGGAEPCLFSPYSDINVRDTSLWEALKSKLFTAH